MPRISAEFSLSIAVKPEERVPLADGTSISIVDLISQARSVGMKAVMQDDLESLFWLPFDAPMGDRRIVTVADNKTKGLTTSVRGSFACRLREGVAPYLQSIRRSRKLSLVIEALNITTLDMNVHEVRIDSLVAKAQRNAISWKLH